MVTKSLFSITELGMYCICFFLILEILNQDAETFKKEEKDSIQPINITAQWNIY